MAEGTFKSGFIAVVGRTNVGKSTLLNTILGQKLSIVSDKPQTTRNNIRLIHTTENCQMVFIDTPGFHKPKSRLSSWMVSSAQTSVRHVDAVLFVSEEEKGIGPGDRMLLSRLSEIAAPVVAVVNKIDRMPKPEVLAKIKELASYPFLKEIVPVSALKNENIDTLLSVLEKYLPAGPAYFPEDMVTDRAEKFFLSEILREKCLAALSEEIPHALAAVVEEVNDAGSITHVTGVIYCDRESHKGIIIGKGGAMLKRIATMARHDMEQLLDSHVNLKVWVKVKKGWREQEAALRSLGYSPRQQEDEL